MPSELTTHGRTRGGYLILIGIFLAAIVIFNLNALSDLTREEIDIVALLPDASGVRVGTPVRVAGVEAGRVLAIAFLPIADSAEVALTLRIEGDARTVLRADSDVRAIRIRVIGQPVVQLEPGSPSAPPVGPGDTLRATPRPDPLHLLERSRSLPGALDSLHDATVRLRAMAGGRAPDLERLGTGLAAVVDAAGALSRDLEQGSLGRMLGPGGAMDRLAQLRARLDEVAAVLGPALARYGAGAGGDGAEAGETGEADGSGELGAALRAVAGRVATLRTELDAMGARMAEGGGILDRMGRDSALQVAVRGVQAQIDSLRAEAASIALRMILP